MSELDALALRVQLPGFEGTVLPPDVLDLYAEGLGGLCLFGANTADGPDALAELTAAVHKASPGAVVAVDEEGGDVTRLHAATGTPVLGPTALGSADDLELTRHVAGVVGTELAAAGVDLDLAPVADVNSDPRNPVIGTRSFGSDPTLVGAHTAAWVAGLQAAGVAACAKHFPGHGDTADDSHLSLPTVQADLQLLERRELVPFVAAVEAGAAAVMTSHIVVPALDPELPATLSRPVLDVLRDRLGFEGLIVTDALDMAGASAGRGIPEAAVLSLAAGADLLCLGPGKDPDLVRAVQSAVTAAVADGRLSADRLAEAADRVTRLVRGDGQTVAIDDDRILEAARRALELDGVMPELAGAEIVSVATPANIAVGEVPWGLPPDRTVRPGEALGGARPIVLQVRDAHRRPELAPLLGAAALVLEWGWPGPWDGVTPRICPQGYSLPGASAVLELLRKAGWDG